MIGQPGVLVFARHGSSRLAGKPLLDIGGRTLLGRVLDRVRRLTTVPVVVCTSLESSDDAIEVLATNEAAACFRGPLHDVAARALGAATQFGFDRFARVCGDRPFLDPTLIRDFLALAAEGQFDLVTNAIGGTYAPGLTTEVVRTSALARIVDATADPEDREHLTRFFYRRPSGFRIHNVPAPHGRYAGTRLVVDTVEDLERARSIAGALVSNPEADTPEQIVALGRAFDALRTGVDPQ